MLRDGLRTNAAQSATGRAEARAQLRGIALQSALILLAALAYFAVRGMTRSSYDEAAANARTLVDLERRLGIDWELMIQGWVIGSDSLVTAVNWIYIYGHWPLIGLVLVVLHRRTPSEFTLLRNAMFVSGGIGLVIFALHPVAPPRLDVLEVIDTISDRSVSYRTLQPPGLVNPYAALPSLHFGWNLLVGIAIWRSTPQVVVRTFAALMPVAMGFSIVATGNHYVIDAVAGAAVALIGLLVALRLPASDGDGDGRVQAGVRPRMAPPRAALGPRRRGRESARDMNEI